MSSGPWSGRLHVVLASTVSYERLLPQVLYKNQFDALGARHISDSFQLPSAVAGEQYYAQPAAEGRAFGDAIHAEDAEFFWTVARFRISRPSSTVDGTDILLSRQQILQDQEINRFSASPLQHVGSAPVTTHSPATSAPLSRVLGTALQRLWSTHPLPPPKPQTSSSPLALLPHFQAAGQEIPTPSNTGLASTLQFDGAAVPHATTADAAAVLSDAVSQPKDHSRRPSEHAHHARRPLEQASDPPTRLPPAPVLENSTLTVGDVEIWSSAPALCAIGEIYQNQHTFPFYHDLPGAVLAFICSQRLLACLDLHRRLLVFAYILAESFVTVMFEPVGLSESSSPLTTHNDKTHGTAINALSRLTHKPARCHLSTSERRFSSVEPKTASGPSSLGLGPPSSSKRRILSIEAAYCCKPQTDNLYQAHGFMPSRLRFVRPRSLQDPIQTCPSKSSSSSPLYLIADALPHLLRLPFLCEPSILQPSSEYYDRSAGAPFRVDRKPASRPNPSPPLAPPAPGLTQLSVS
ncbi:hypothetical protein R3P38DRAFT_3252078 [Favolaschia claudopus]|uniref:Uncharacterized protein n=1 Tax=Favolaschia claudopus TaxID=2862362 RepID=A0AAW0E6H4_9AGAR